MQPFKQFTMLTENETYTSDNTGAEFSLCRKYRFALWRIWDNYKPIVMFIGLNPSKANETEVDATIKSVIRISKHNGYGGFYMMNCFPLVSTNPDDLIIDDEKQIVNDSWLFQISKKCNDIVFAWGNFKVVRDKKRDKELAAMFPNAKAIGFNANNSPKHPLFIKGATDLTDYKTNNHGN